MDAPPLQAVNVRALALRAIHGVLMVYTLAAFVALAFLAGTVFRAPMLAALAVASLVGSAVALVAAGYGILAAVGWAILITLLVEAAFIAGLAAVFMLDEALIRSGRNPVRRNRPEPLTFDLDARPDR